MFPLLKVLSLSTALLLPVAAAHATVRTEAGLSESKVGASETYRLNVPVEKEISTTEVRLVVPAGVTITLALPEPLSRTAQGSSPKSFGKAVSLQWSTPGFSSVPAILTRLAS